MDAASGCFAIFEHLNMGGRASPERAELMGVQLAQMHRSLSPNGKYGFHVDNTIGGTVHTCSKEIDARSGLICGTSGLVSG